MKPSNDLLSRYLLALDNESFFALFRNYRGPVDTPYNKHDLITDLRDFLSREYTQKRIVAMLDRDDLIVLSAIDLLHRPDILRLARFLDGEIEDAELRSRVLNLKDRLLIVDDEDGIALNPVLGPALHHAGIGPDQLVSGTVLSPQEQLTSAGAPWFSIPYAAAMYAFLREHADLFTRAGSLRKRTITDLEERFPQVLAGDAGALRLRSTIVAFETLGLLRHVEESVVLRPDSWEELARIPDRSIQALLWGASLTGSVDRAFSFARLLLDLAQAIPTDRAYTLGETLRLMQLTGGGTTLPIDRDTLFRLVEIGFFLADDERFRLNPAVATVIDPGFGGSAHPRVQANMEITIPPGTSYRETLLVARIADLGRFDTVPIFVLSESSVTNARQDGVDDPQGQLTAIAGELPQNVRFLLNRWQKRAGSIRLIRGLVMIATEETAAALRGLREFREMVREEPAPGVFLVTDEPRRLERILSRHELTPSVTVEGARPVDVHVPEYDRLHAQHSQRDLLTESPRTTTAPPDATSAGPTSAAGPGGSPGGTDGGETGATLARDLKDKLERMDLPEDVRRELSLRIDRKLILFPEQIRGDVVPHYGTEARGLDYLGKIRLIEQAITGGDMLEIVMRAQNGSPQRLLVQPREVVERGDDLMLRARQEPDRSAIQIRIRRISLVRRLSGTLLRRTPG